MVGWLSVDVGDPIFWECWLGDLSLGVWVPVKLGGWERGMIGGYSPGTGARRAVLKRQGEGGEGSVWGRLVLGKGGRRDQGRRGGDGLR